MPVEAGPRAYRLSFLLFVAYACHIAVYQGLGVILLPAAVQRIAPTNKVGVLALLTTLSAVTTVFALIAGGAISDRTRSRWGRRTPALAISCAASALLLPVMAAARSVNELLVLMPLLGFTLNFYQGVFLAQLPDRVPAESRGFASAAIALGVPAGIFFGINLAALAPSPLIGYLGLASLFVAGTVTLFVVAPESSSLDLVLTPRARGRPRAMAELFVSFGDRDFALTFVSRFVLFVAYFSVMGYLFYVVQDYVGIDRLPQRNPSLAVSQVMSLATLGWVLITPVTGVIADRVHRTPMFVGLSSIGIGLAMFVPALSNGWPAMMIFGTLMGLSFGIYMAIDLKLMAMVLPSPETAGRDIGILSVASSGPIVLAPSLAAAIIALGSYRALFMVGALTAILGGVLAIFIRKRG